MRGFILIIAKGFVDPQKVTFFKVGAENERGPFYHKKGTCLRGDPQECSEAAVQLVQLNAQKSRQLMVEQPAVDGDANVDLSGVTLTHSGAGSAAAQPWNNNWDGAQRFDCPSGQALTALYSVHNNGAEDRLWSLKCESISQGSS